MQNLKHLLLSATTGLALGGAALPVAAANCTTGAKAAADIWNKYDEVAMKVGCAAAAGATAAATAGAGLPAAAAQYAECFKTADKANSVTRKMISGWNDLNQNGWGTFGPRKLLTGNTYDGNVLGQSTRMYITPAPLTSDMLDLSVVKRRLRENRGRAEVTVCRFPPAGPGTDVSGEKLWSFQVSPGNDNAGKEWSGTLSGVRGHIVTVAFKSQSAVKSFKYSLSTQATTSNRTVVIAGSEKSGLTDYRIQASGQRLEQLAGEIDGYSVSLDEGQDRISGLVAQGRVGSGNDAYRVIGDFEKIELADPSAAVVYVDGERYQSQASATRLPDAALEWTGTYTGRSDGRNARLTIEPNADSTALEMRYEDLDRDTELTKTVPARRLKKVPDHFLEDLRFKGGGNSKHFGRLLLHSGGEHIAGHSLWGDTRFGVAFSEGGLESSLGDGGRVRGDSGAGAWAGTYRGFGDGRRVELDIEAQGKTLDLTWRDLDRNATFSTEILMLSEGPVHVIEDVEMTGPDGTKQIGHLYLHTWDDHYISGNTLWRDTPYGAQFARVDD